MKIGLDMMGGDHAPLEAVKGVELFFDSVSEDVHLVLIGQEELLAPLLATHRIPADRYTLVHAPEVIGMHEHPTKALKSKPLSSINLGFQLLSDESIQAFISAGNTGAMMVGVHYSIKSIEGILRPTISTIVPRENGIPGLLLDVGINADCKPENLVQFAELGTLYARHILKIEEPKTGLLNIGEEEGKGNILCQATYPLLKENTKINFIGNIEGRDIFDGKADVMVCEGFTGNVVLKLAESIYDIVCKRDIQDAYLRQFNYEFYGGTPVLGVAEPVVIGHGISRAPAFKSMISLAQQMIESRLLDKIRENFTPRS